MPAKQYTLIFASLLFILLGLTALFSRVVDPFWYYRDVSIVGFNAVKPKFRYYERHVKPAILQREQPASLIFGSSFSEIGFDPLHPALAAAGKSYNFGIGGAGWEMVSCNVQFAISHDPALRQIVLGIQPAAMPLRNCAAEIAKMEHPDERAFLLSREALEGSINTVLEQYRQKPSHTAEGMYFYTRGVSGTAGRFHEYFTRHLSCKMDHAVVVQPDSGSHIHSAASGAMHAVVDLSGLRDIVDKAVARGIAVKLVVYPRHALSVELEYQCGIRQNRWDVLAQIASLVERDTKGLVEVWDFEGYHGIGTEIISDAPGVYWQDPAHFNYEFGSIMLDEMFAVKSPRIGLRITSANLAARIGEEREARAIHISNHPEFLRQLDNLLSHNAY